MSKEQTKNAASVKIQRLLKKKDRLEQELGAVLQELSTLGYGV